MDEACNRLAAVHELVSVPVKNPTLWAARSVRRSLVSHSLCEMSQRGDYQTQERVVCRREGGGVRGAGRGRGEGEGGEGEAALFVRPTKETKAGGSSVGKKRGV